MTNQNHTKSHLGLTTEKAKELQIRFGKNQLTPDKDDNFFMKILHVLGEPMFILLIIAAVIYFLLGEPRDGAIMLIFVMGVISIDIIQEWKTDKTLKALKDLSAPQIRVIRDGKESTILSSDLVPGDAMLINEGLKIPADGMIIKANDLCVDESSLTGEAEGVWKVAVGNEEPLTDYWKKDYCYAGTLVTQGSAVVLVDKIGSSTEYGKIGTNISEVVDSPTPLQKQTRSLVMLCSTIAAGLFILVAVFTYFNISNHKFVDRIIESILSGVTLAMAMIPEEFPVILTVFLSMGAWRLAKKNSLVHKLPSVETLGAVSVLCVDKTGTITKNEMTVTKIWSLDGKEIELAEVMGLACETEAYDPMEKAMVLKCENLGVSKKDLFSGALIKEYPFTNELKVMGHVWNHQNKIIVAAKGSSEKILSLCKINSNERRIIEDKILTLSKEGLRIIAVGKMELENVNEIPDNIDDCKLTFCGLIGLTDPPRDNVKEDIEQCIKAGIRVVMITGDNGITASAIAKKVGMNNCDNIITGSQLDEISDEELREKIKYTNIFSRVVPEHKMRIVKAFKENGEIVAMTGDGVNDAPALKYADIGIAMGKRGSEVSREAADLILMDDNFSTIVDTIRDGRRIYDNIRKAVGYVFSIHIPIAAASLCAPFLGISPANSLLLPLHVVLLELIIDPTCSIVLERQPAEKNIMERGPRPANEKLINGKSLLLSVIQGLMIFLISFGTYLLILKKSPDNADLARTMGLSIIIFANLFLVQIISSEYEYMYKSLKKIVKDRVMLLINSVTIIGLLAIIYTPINETLKLRALSFKELVLTIILGGVSVFWYEGIKFIRRLAIKKQRKICVNCKERLNCKCNFSVDGSTKVQCLNKINM